MANDMYECRDTISSDYSCCNDDYSNCPSVQGDHRIIIFASAVVVAVDFMKEYGYKNNCGNDGDFKRL